RGSTVTALPSTIKPLFGARAKSVTAPSISGTSRPLIELNSIPSDGAADSSTANCAIPAGRVGSRRTAARVTPGAMSRISSSHFPLMPYSIESETGGVAAWVRQALHEARADRIGGQREHDRHRAGQLEQRPCDRAAAGQDDVRRERKELGRVFMNALGIARAPA